ncbi:MAG TPA: BlaI/MecI/CopY family transcriptional regulator [Sphingomonas sp.]|uniref:BlaI/MecI/CopY family transcriptional regulator n=1 Tax=Sphingomonas sp. TaxID=28214 RepID=UPI002BFFF198|nr:BlaI/MecI/CopY family transcriptional regulator [Sphingomonas sp.]HMI17932.1 BlaI/MecI/CopY family transcriptional regulator [Sphingomonas sp.]
MAERISEGEQAVMEVLWADAPLTASEVAERIPDARNWSERTVKTMLGRLLSKGALVHEEDGRRYLYRPAVERADYASRETRRLADRLFGGRAAPLVAHLAAGDGLTDQDIAELEALLKDLKS